MSPVDHRSPDAPVVKQPTPPVPMPVERAIKKLGEDIALARRRRGISQKSLAWRIGASESTLRRLERVTCASRWSTLPGRCMYSAK
jgi:ribosome-binding protein aMBF1 (putative translation factor)